MCIKIGESGSSAPRLGSRSLHRRSLSKYKETEKAMKKTVSALLALIMIISILTLSSCGKDDGAPDGMRLVMGGEDVGYYFYGPEEWIVANLGDIACTYASKVDMSSMTFVETEKPQGTVGEYFASEKTKFPYEISVSVDGEECLFGNANGKAYKYVYSYSYKDISYTCMQIFVEHSERFYIFTFTSSNSDYSEDETYYEFYLEKVSAAIDAFKFTDKKDGTIAEPEYEHDEDGYILVSDEKLAGFKMYVPEAYKVDYSSGMVSVSHADGTNITMSQATYTSVNMLEYWQSRMDNINSFAGGTCKGVRPLDKDNIEDVNIPGTRNAKAYEYTYTYEGISYHVYQVIIVESSTNTYVFTYTASEENYNQHLDEMKSVLVKIDY